MAAAAPSLPKRGRTRAAARLILSSDYPEHPEISSSPLPRPLQREEEEEAEAAATPPFPVLHTLPPQPFSRDDDHRGDRLLRHGCPHPRQVGSGACRQILHPLRPMRKREKLRSEASRSRASFQRKRERCAASSLVGARKARQAHFNYGLP
ncbi:hypothetical protein mRhiFer1_009018 [Rhinolophus ferrumequinum]|uniref:Uncharacterized protein n=1 Tax=Rhinolophus ferrumequinum TaxID=59479 RepID=A0A7J7SYD7_RHIFE|nr:hypothetical protein mRhiFer1_009018 [Rhinolophus ferrumequinum]